MLKSAVGLELLTTLIGFYGGGNKRKKRSRTSDYIFKVNSSVVVVSGEYYS